jgi:hypothetical protein
VRGTCCTRTRFYRVFVCVCVCVCVQAAGRLAFLRRSREVLEQQHELDTRDFRAVLTRLRKQLEVQPQEQTGTPQTRTGGLLHQLLLRVQSRSRRNPSWRVGDGESIVPDETRVVNAAVFDADIVARIRILAVEDRLVFELTKRADLLRSVEDALRRRRAALATVRGATEESGISADCYAAPAAGEAAPPLVVLANSRLRLIEDEIETLDMRLGVVERRCHDAIDELRVASNQRTPNRVGGGFSFANSSALGSDEHIAVVSQSLSASAARGVAEDLVLRLCDMGAQLRASRAQLVASDHALQMAMQDAERLRGSLRNQHVHWAAQLVASQRDAAENELVLARALAANEVSAGNTADVSVSCAKIAPAMLRRMEALERENAELNRLLKLQREMQSSEPQPAPQSVPPEAAETSLATFPELPPSPGVDSVDNLGSVREAEEPNDADATVILPTMARVDSGRSSSSSGTTSAVHPYIFSPLFGGNHARLWPVSRNSEPLPPPLPQPPNALVAPSAVVGPSLQFLEHCRAVLNAAVLPGQLPPLIEQLRQLSSALSIRLSRCCELAVQAHDLCSDLALDLSAAVAGSRETCEAASSLGKKSVRQSLVSLFTLLARVPPSLLTPQAAIIVQGVCGRSSGSPDVVLSPKGAPATPGEVVDMGWPPSTFRSAVSHPGLPLDTGVGAGLLLGTPAEVKALVRARVRAREAGSGGPPTTATTFSPVSVAPPALPTSDWLSDGSADSRDTFLAFASLPAESLHAAAIEGWATAVLQLSVMRAHRRSVLHGVMRAINASGRGFPPFNHHQDAYMTLSYACGLAEGSLPPALVYRLLECLVDAYGDDATAVTRAIDELRSWRSTMGWPLDHGAAPLHTDRLNNALWSRLLSWASDSELNFNGTFASGSDPRGDPLSGSQRDDLVGSVSDATMLHAVALALMMSGAAARADTSLRDTLESPSLRDLNGLAAETGFGSTGASASESDVTLPGDGSDKPLAVQDL